MTVRRTMMFCADTMRIFSSITTRASVSIEAVLFSVFRTGVLSYLRVFTKTIILHHISNTCLLYTSPSPRDRQKSRMPSSA